MSWRCAAEESKTGRSRCEIQCSTCKAWWNPEFNLASIAPRLALARDQRAVEIRLEDFRQARLASKRLQKDRLVAHRELQLLRAGAKGNRRYVKRRSQKLDQAIKERKALG